MQVNKPVVTCYTCPEIMIAAIRSIEEWIASEIMLTDPLISPTANFIIISNVLDNIESRATFTLAFIVLS